MRLIKFLAVILIITASCKKKGSVSTENFYVALKATLNGKTQVPANASKDSGLVAATYNRSTMILKVNLTWTNLTATSAHIHKGAAGTSGAVVFTFTGTTSPINYTSVALTTAQETDLLAGLYYVDIHTTTYPNGEIRGQLVKL